MGTVWMPTPEKLSGAYRSKVRLRGHTITDSATPVLQLQFQMAGTSGSSMRVVRWDAGPWMGKWFGFANGHHLPKLHLINNSNQFSPGIGSSTSSLCPTTTPEKRKRANANGIICGRLTRKRGRPNGLQKMPSLTTTRRSSAISMASPMCYKVEVVRTRYPNAQTGLA